MIASNCHFVSDCLEAGCSLVAAVSLDALQTPLARAEKSPPEILLGVQTSCFQKNKKLSTAATVTSQIKVAVDFIRGGGEGQK